MQTGALGASVCFPRAASPIRIALSGISFLRPDVLRFAALLALALLPFFLLRRPRFLAFTAVQRVQLAGCRGSPLRRMPWALVASAVALIVVALMEPVLPYAESTIEAEGLDIVLVLDLSSSMADPMGVAADVVRARRRVPATRLDVTKQALRTFVTGRREDRIGLVVFASSAYVITPLTFDYDHLLGYIGEITGDLRRETAAGHVIIESGTAIGEGIHLAHVLLARQSVRDVRNKVIVVFTDGEHNSGRDPLEALHETDAAGIRVHLIGIDLERGVRMKPAVLNLIATIARSGGQYFHAESAGQLRAASAALSALEPGRLVGRRIERDVPVYGWFAIPAVILIAAAIGLRAVPYFADLT